MPRLLLDFAGCTVPADIDGPPELFAVFERFGIRIAATERQGEPSIIVAFAGGRFHLSGPAYLAPFSVDGTDTAIGSLLSGLAACKALSLEGHALCLHAAAAVIGERGFLFLAPFGTGKSSLMAALAVLGAGVLADDVVLLNTRDRTISGLAMPPRLRRAFVGTAAQPVKQWIARQAILAGPRYTYLDAATLAPGAHALTDIVLLNRLDDAAGQAEPCLEAASPGAVIPRLLWHNMSRHHAPSAIAAMTSGLAAGLRCSILHAGNFAQAAERLADGSIRTRAGGSPTALAHVSHDQLQVIRTDRGAIISDDQSGRIFEINESAFVILTLLQKLGDAGQVTEALRTIYPDVAEGDLAAQLALCTRQFADCGLIGLPPG